MCRLLLFNHRPNLIEWHCDFSRQLERQMSGTRIAKDRASDFRDAGNALRQRRVKVRTFVQCRKDRRADLLLKRLAQ